jgi:hypothetical protein
VFSALFAQKPAQCDVFFRTRETWILPYRSPAEGLWLPTAPLTTLEPDTPLDLVAHAAHRALSQSKVGHSAVMPPNPLATKLGSQYMQLYVATRCLRVRRDAAGCHVVPHATHRNKFEPLEERSLSLPRSVGKWDEVFAEALRCCTQVSGRGDDAATSAGPLPFGFKSAWLAVPASSLDEAVSRLPLDNPVLTAWEDGLQRCQDGGFVYVTPPLRGWCLLVGDFPLPDDAQSPRLEVLRHIASRFPQMYLFATHRGSGFGLWARWKDGELLRAVARGEDEWTLGEPLPEEAGLDLSEEEDVMKLAGAVSVDPTALQPQKGFPSGRLGQWNLV